MALSAIGIGELHGFVSYINDMNPEKHEMRAQEPARILMLVPHEPGADPRVEWVKQLCLKVGATDVIGALSVSEAGVLREKPIREYDGRVYIERINVFEFSSIGAKGVHLLASIFHVGGTIRRYIKRESESGESFGSTLEGTGSRSRLRMCSSVKAVLARIDHRIGSVCRFFSNLASFGLIVSALYRRGRAASILPRLIICHDIFALASAVLLKRVFGCPILYDSHELWPEADLIAQQWEKRLTAWIEGNLVKHADVVVTVSPPLARHLERIYRLPYVVSAPNAEPLRPFLSRSREASTTKPVKCLLQGRVSPRRGIEELFAAWRSIQKTDAVLYLRCPQNEYLFELRRKFQKMIESGTIVLLSAVQEEELVEAAVFADVGVIPYRNMSLIHQYCCPNKLSQYMQAGLAILGNNLDYVSTVLKQYRCGITYDAENPESLPEAVARLASRPDELQKMKENAFRASQSEFNWEAQSAEYGEAIRRLYTRGNSNSESLDVRLSRQYA